MCLASLIIDVGKDSRWVAEGYARLIYHTVSIWSLIRVVETWRLGVHHGTVGLIRKRCLVTDRFSRRLCGQDRGSWIQLTLLGICMIICRLALAWQHRVTRMMKTFAANDEWRWSSHVLLSYSISESGLLRRLKHRGGSFVELVLVKRCGRLGLVPQAISGPIARIMIIAEVTYMGA